MSYRTLLSFNGQFVPLGLSLSSGGVQRCIDVTENLSDGMNLTRDQSISTQMTHNTNQETDDECLAMVIPQLTEPAAGYLWDYSRLYFKRYWFYQRAGTQSYGH